MKTKMTYFVLAAALAFGAPSLFAADAKATYDKSCASCHGKEGKGDTPMGKKLKVKDYTDAKVQGELTDDQMFKDIKEGVKKDGKEVMKGYGGKLTDDEIKALVTYIRAFKK